jgi:hypothetical protein
MFEKSKNAVTALIYISFVSIIKIIVVFFRQRVILMAEVSLLLKSVM